MLGVFAELKTLRGGVKAMSGSIYIDRIQRCLILLAGALLAPAASANDSEATLEVGGLIFTKTDAIRMESEELYISLDETRVAYRFTNTSNRDVTAIVAFPLPELETETPYASRITADEQPYYPLANPFGFRVKVNGAEVAPNLELTHVFMGEDMPKTVKAVIEHVSDNSVVKSQRGDVSTLTYKYYWEQKFPAGQETRVEHSYKTSPGTGRISEKSDTGIKPGGAYCYDESFIGGFTKYLEKLRKSPDYAMPGKPPAEVENQIGAHLHFESLNEVKYILTTGANWKGPIGSFKLTIDKGDPATLISTCFDGLKKTGPATFTANFTNYTPKRDLAILFVKTGPKKYQ
jgi:hypothetical protein